MPKLRRSRPPSPTVGELKLKKVVPVIPTTEPERTQLMEDLTKIGCEGLAVKPWGFKEERVVRELLGKLSNQFDGTIRGRPDLWKEEHWRDVYSFAPGGLTTFSRKDEFCHGRFRKAVHDKDGYAVSDCIDNRHRRLLEFLIPILHPDKPKTLTITIGNQVFGAIVGNRKMNWSRIMGDLVSSMLPRIGKSWATPVCPYLFHLYKENGLLAGTEEKTWKNQETLLKYGESGSEDESEGASGSETESGEEEDPKPPTKRQKTTSPTGRGNPPTPTKRRTPEPTGKAAEAGPSGEKDPKDPFVGLINLLCGIRADWEVKKAILEEIGKLVDSKPDRNLTKKVADCITNPEETRKMEAEVRRLQEEVDALKLEAYGLKEDISATKEMADEVKKVADDVKATFGEPGSMEVRAQLYDEGVLKDNKMSSAKMVRILGDFVEQVEASLVGAREAAKRMEESSSRLTGMLNPGKDIRLSDLSLPEFSLAVPGGNAEKA